MRRHDEAYKQIERLRHNAADRQKDEQTDVPEKEPEAEQGLRPEPGQEQREQRKNHEL